MRVVVLERWPRFLTTGRCSDACERVALEVATHVFPGGLPHGEEYALPLVVTGPVLMWLAKVTEDDGSINGGDDLREPNVLGWSGEDVSTTDPPLGTDQTSAFECQQDLFQVGLG